MAAHFHKSSAGPGGGTSGVAALSLQNRRVPSPPPKVKEAKRHARRAVKRPGPYLVPWANY